MLVNQTNGYFFKYFNSFATFNLMIKDSTAEVKEKIAPEILSAWNKVKANKSKYGFISAISKQSGLTYYAVVKAFNTGFATVETIGKIDSVISKM